jgi:uncharacterized protein YlzI (FlbEa/FlbD family)
MSKFIMLIAVRDNVPCICMHVRADHISSMEIVTESHLDLTRITLTNGQNITVAANAYEIIEMIVGSTPNVIRGE